MTKLATTLSGRIRPSRLGAMLHLYRTVHHLTLRDLEQPTGISKATLMRIEHGQAFDMDTFLKLWNWLSESA